jgi:hypothetical protein
VALAAAQLLAVAVDEQQRVIGAGAEDQDQEQEGALGVDGDRAGLDQQVGDADRDHVGGADDEQRHDGQQRRPVDDEQQDQDQAEGRDQQRLAGFACDLLEVGGDSAGPGHVGAEAGAPVSGEVLADRFHAFLDRAAFAGVDRQHDQRRFAVARQRPDPVGDRGDVAERGFGVGREGVDDRRRPGDLQPVEAVADAPDRLQIGLGQSPWAVEDDHDRNLFAGLLAALEVVEGAGRFGVLGQEAGLPGGGDVVDLGAADEARDGDRQPDRDHQPAAATAGDGLSETPGHGLDGSASTGGSLAPAEDPTGPRLVPPVRG